MELNVLEILDKMESFRRRNQNSSPDYCMRALEAILAKYGGFKGRADWTDKLISDESTAYRRYILYREDV